MLFFGRKMNMSKQEILITRYGDMLDMISCLCIYEGKVAPKRKERKKTYDEIMQLR